MFDFLFQITFFVACLALDEKRLLNGRLDCCFCWKAKLDKVRYTDEVKSVCTLDESTDMQPRRRCGGLSLFDWNFESALEYIFRPIPRATLLLLALAYTCFSIYNVTNLTSAFDFRSLLPNDSFFHSFYDSINNYFGKGLVPAFVYFRDVDHSDPFVRQEMVRYIDEIVESVETPFNSTCWVTYFEEFIESTGDYMKDLPFEEQLDLFLSVSEAKEHFNNVFAWSDDGTILFSQCTLGLAMRTNDTDQQLSVFNSVQEVTRLQQINDGSTDSHFFLYEPDIFPLAEVLALVMHELYMTTVTTIAAVTLLAFLMIPHWSAAFLILPIVTAVYIQVLGTMQLTGLTVNAITVICSVLTVGLIVDYVMHILIHYFELDGTRQERAMATLRSIGASVFLGGLSTFVGIVFMAFCSTYVFYAFFTVFFIVVIVGLVNGMIFLPLLLSLVGPQKVRPASKAVRDSGIESITDGSSESDGVNFSS